MTVLHELEGRVIAAIRSDMEIPVAEAAAVAADGVRAPSHQLEVYREQYWLRHVGSLREDFPTLIALVGDDAFDALARKFLAAHPPASRFLTDLGRALPAFCAKSGLAEAPCDAARLDWAFMVAGGAADAPALVAADLQGIAEDDWARVVFDFHPSLQALRMCAPVHLIRDGEGAEGIGSAPVSLVVCREPDLHVRAHTVDDGALRLIEALRSGAALGPACESLFASDAAPPPIGVWFQAWVRLGWICSPLRIV